MPRSSAGNTKSRILEAAYRLFYRRGYGRVGVDEIAAAAGITKRTLYYHYPSKDDLIGDVLRHQHGLALARVVKDGQGAGGSAESLLSRRFADFRKWCASRGWTGSGFSRLAMELADLPGHPARRMARRHKLQVETWLAEALARSGEPDARTRAREISLLTEGAMVMVLITGDRSYVDIAERMARRLERGSAG
jgi:AcrR family transcriptional regulator